MSPDQILREAARIMAADPALGEEFFQRAGIVPIHRGRRSRLRRMILSSVARAGDLDGQADSMEDGGVRMVDVRAVRARAARARKDARIARQWLRRYAPPARQNPYRESRPSADYVLRSASRILSADPGLLREFLLHTGPRRVLEEMGIVPLLHVRMPHAYDPEDQDFIGTFDEWRDEVESKEIYSGEVDGWELYLGRRVGMGWRTDRRRAERGAGQALPYPASEAEDVIARRGGGDGSWWMSEPPPVPSRFKKKKRKKARRRRL